MNENEKPLFPPGLYEKISDYLSARIRLGKLGFIEVFSKISVSLLWGVIIGFFTLMVLFLFGFGLAQMISFLNHDSFSGFYWVGTGFLVLLLILLGFRKTLMKNIQNQVIRFLSKTLLDDEGI